WDEVTDHKLLNVRANFRSALLLGPAWLGAAERTVHDPTIVSVAVLLGATYGLFRLTDITISGPQATLVWVLYERGIMTRDEALTAMQIMTLANHYLEAVKRERLSVDRVVAALA